MNKREAYIYYSRSFKDIKSNRFILCIDLEVGLFTIGSIRIQVRKRVGCMKYVDSFYLSKVEGEFVIVELRMSKYTLSSVLIDYWSSYGAVVVKSGSNRVRNMIQRRNMCALMRIIKECVRDIKNREQLIQLLELIAEPTL